MSCSKTGVLELHACGVVRALARNHLANHENLLLLPLLLLLLLELLAVAHFTLAARGH